MNYSKIKTFISNLLSGSLPIEDSQPNIDPEPPIVTSIRNVLGRINAGSTVDSAMKEYANRLVHVYLNSITGNYYGCVGAADDTAARLGRSIEDIRDEIMSHIEACLIDIEHGAVFKDNLSDVFLTCMLDFEQQLESRTAY